MTPRTDLRSSHAARRALPVATALVLLFASASMARAELLQLDGWDSGAPAAFQGGFVAGEIAAVRLVPTGPCPCTVNEVRFLFGGGAGTHDVTIRIWDDAAGTNAPGTPLHAQTVAVTGSDEFMQSVELTGGGVTVSGPFRVGLEFTHAGTPSVARDADSSIDTTANFIFADGLGWFPSWLFGLTGDWIIRAVVDETPIGAGSELANDGWTDGGVAGFQGGFVAGEIAAVRLVPPGPCPCSLDAVRFLFGGGAGTHDAILRIWNDSAETDTPGPELYHRTIALTGSDEFMQEVSIGGIGLTIDGPVRIGLEFTHAGVPSVARDDDGLHPDRNFIFADGLGWVQSSLLGLTGDWIIRAVIDAAPIASGALLANDGWTSGEAVAFQGGFVAGESAAVRLDPVGPCPCPIQKLRFLFGGAPGTQSVTLRIYDDAALGLNPGALLWSTSVQLTGSDEVMQEIDIGVAGVSVGGTFRVAFEFSHSGLPSVARDTDGITANRNFVAVSGLGWVEASTLGVTGDWIIRAVQGGESAGELLVNDGWLDGQPAAFQGGFVAGETAAVRFLPSGPCPCQLDQIRLLFGGAGTTEDVILRVWDDSGLANAPGTLLYSDTITLTGSDAFEQELDVTVAGITVNGPFRVGFEFLHSGPPSLARDSDGITAGRNFVNVSGLGWLESSAVGVTGDWIVRAVVDSLPGVLLASDSFVSATAAVFETGFVETDVAAARFVPPGPCPCALQDVRFLFGGSPDPKVVRLSVWDDAALADDPGAELFSAEYAITPDDQALQVIDLAGAALDVTGAYRVGLAFQHADAPALAIDDDGLTAGRNFVNLGGGGWQASSEAGDFVLRSTVSVPEPGVIAMLGAGIVLLGTLHRRREMRRAGG